MGKRKKISSSERWAIWTAYGMKCFWCKRILDFSECEVDHVIPDSTSKIVLQSMAKDYQLGEDFSLESYANLVPSCLACRKKRSSGAFRRSSELPSWFEMIRNKIPMVEGKVRQIDGELSLKEALKELVEKAERGEITPEFAERVAGPFLRAVEGASKGSVEFRFTPKVRMFHESERVRLVPFSEIQYEKFVEGMVESGDFKQRNVERLKEGPSFGEGRPRRPGSGG